MTDSSREYDKFIFTNDNRDIDPVALERLIKAIDKKNFLNVNPIIVKKQEDGSLLVFDGQHRLLAAKKLNVPIFYNVTEEMTLEDVPALNTARQNWFLHDYLKHFAAHGNGNYIQLKDFVEKNGFTVTQSILMTSKKFGGGTSCFADFRHGSFVLKDLEFAETVAKNLLEVAKYIPFYKHDHFIRAMIIISRRDDYDHERMMTKLDQCSTYVTRCPDTISYIKVLERAYNYKCGTKTCVYFSDEFRGRNYL